MNESKRKKLEAAGWRFGSADEFLGLSDVESTLVDLRLAFSHALKTRRARLHLTQRELAERIDSSQSRVAKMEAGDPEVSFDLLFRGLLATGATRKDLATVLDAQPKESVKRIGRRRVSAPLVVRAHTQKDLHPVCAKTELRTFEAPHGGMDTRTTEAHREELGIAASIAAAVRSPSPECAEPAGRLVGTTAGDKRVPRAGMRVAAVIVSAHRFRDPLGNGERLDLAGQIARAALDNKVDLVVLPAGFLAASSVLEVGPLSEELAKEFSELAVVAGIDVELGRSATSKAKRHRRPDDFYVFTADKGNVGATWTQRVISGHDSIDGDLESRFCLVTGNRIGILACGEVYHRGLHAAAAACDPKIVVDLGHKGMGRGFEFTLPQLARTTGATVIHAQHVAVRSHHARKWRASRIGPTWSTESDWISDSQNEERGELWAEIKLWEI